MSVTVVNKGNFEVEVLQSEKPVLVDFWAEWCGPCRMLSPIVDQVAEEATDIKVCKINIDEENELAAQFKIMTIPTLVVFKDGAEVKRSSGVIAKTAIFDLLK